MSPQERELRAWAANRIAECRRQELRLSKAWHEAQAKTTRGLEPPQGLVKAWTERRALKAVLRILDDACGALIGPEGERCDVPRAECAEHKGGER